MDIKEIPVIRGDKYDPIKHKPISVAEEDDELENDRIKRVVNAGFQFTQHLVFSDPETTNYILTQAGVIVVRNK